MPSLDDLGTSQVVSETPDAADFIPFFDVSEFGSSSRVKRTTVANLVATGITPEAVVEALDGQTIEPAALILSDLSNTAAEDGVLAYKGEALAKHDGVTVGGNLLTQYRVTNTISCDANGESMSTGAQFAVLEIPIPATWMEEGAIIKILGEVKAAFSAGFYTSEEPLTSIKFGVTFPGGQTQAPTYWNAWDVLSASEIVMLATSHLTDGYTLADSTGDLALFHQSGTVISDRWGGAAGTTWSKQDGVVAQGASTPDAEPNTATSIWLCVEIKAGGATFGAEHIFNVFYDLVVDVVLP